MQLEKAIKTRKSVRRFLSKKPDWRKIIKAIDCARFAPSAGNQFVLKFVLVRDKDQIEKLAKATQQDFISQASYVVLVVSDESKLVIRYDERGKIYSRQQAGAAIQNFLLSLNEQGLATTWVGHFDDNAVKMDFEIPEEMSIEGIFPIGRETKVKTFKKPKKELDNIIYFDKFGNRYMKPLERVSHEAI